MNGCVTTSEVLRYYFLPSLHIPIHAVVIFSFADCGLLFIMVQYLLSC